MSNKENTQEYSKDTLRIQIVDFKDNPIENAEVRLIGIKNAEKYDVALNERTNINGEVIFDKIEKLRENTQSFEIRINHPDYQMKPKDNYRRICRSYEYGRLCRATFEPKLSNFAVQKVIIDNKFLLKDIGHTITKNFYKPNDKIMLKAEYDTNKVKHNEIKWGYKKLTTNDYDKQGKATDVDYILFSNLDSYIPTNIPTTQKIDKPLSYNNDTLQLSKTDSINLNIPQKWLNKSVAIFAYKHNPHWKVCQIIKVNDYPQIVIDGTHSEVLRANKNATLTQGEQRFSQEMQTLNAQAKILGWGTSYLLQRLWHDNPQIPNNFKTKDKYAANKGLRYVSSKDIIIDDSSLYEILSNFDEIKLKKLTYKQHIEDSIEYYAELDWDNLYLKFPMMKDLEPKILGKRQNSTTYIQENATHIITENFKNEIKDFLQNTTQRQEIANVFHNDSLVEKEFFIALILDKMQERENLHQDKFRVRDCTTLVPIDTNIIKDSKKEFIYNNQRLKLLTDCKPHEFARIHLQSYPLQDETFARYMGVDMKEGERWSNYWTGFQTMRKSQQEFNQLLDSSPYSKSTIALYAITGKFSIFYLPHKITIKRNGQQANYLECFIDELLCYIYDSFDFSDEPYQPVGMWDYNEVAFNQYESMQHLSVYKTYKDLPHFITAKFASMDTQRMEQDMNRAIEYSKKHNLYYIINQNYQDYQNNFHFGLDYRIFSKNAKVIEIKHNNCVNLKLGVL
ncbi:hypothetical protein HCBAA847_1511 [Helicobacter cinaedi CCUG 18818 = ATCC BAA-847]|uniref:Uncharacterized protein n=4 Tax=Helicobacter cinaedi TaxID=213 RepID=A0AAI8QGK1_9HELI|nr:DUF6402 family protein [Helicobacter cinaedi]BAM32741.1 hypothetical protein HCBAA847_1511 [Helicobacter cinaedi CCUG 18818 = ATCC BAA-847]